VDDISLDSDGGGGYDSGGGGDEVNPDDDESIPDDEAFDSEDDKRWGELLGGKKKGKGKEKEEEEAQDEGDEGSGFSVDDDSDDDSRILSTDEEIMPSDSESADGAQDDVNLSELIDDSKTSSKKKKSAWKGGAQIIQETAVEGGQAQTSQTGDLTLEELIAGTADSGTSLKRVQKKLHRLQEGAGARVDLPESKRLTAEREREITREQVEKDLKKWEPTVRANKKAEFQVFPLPDANPPAKPTTSKLGLEMKAENDMEKEIAGLLEDSGLREEAKAAEIDPSTFMKLETDVAGYAGDEADFDEKQGVAAKLKSVLFYEHQKRRHMKRIKSKAYRRMMRKEQEKQKEKKLELLATIDPEAALQKRKDELLKARAQERMGMRHKNKSQWIKHVKHMAKWDPSVREAMGTQSQIHKKLMQKMDESAEVAGGYQSDNESSAGSEESKQIDSLLTPGGDKSALWNLRKDVEGSDPKKGIWSMKFMKRAAEKEKKEMLNEIDEIERNVDAFRGEAPSGGGEDGEAQGEDPAQLAPAVGKAKFGPGQGGEARLLPAPKHQDQNAGGILKRKRKEVSFASEGGERSLTTDAELTTVVKKERTLRRAAKRKQEEEDAKKEQNGAEEESTGVPAKRRKKGKKEAKEEKEEEAPAAAESPRPAAKRRRKGKADAAGEVLETADGVTLDQDFLIGRAFAADTLAEEFAREKEAEVDKDVAPLDPQLALPGWGEWGGKDPKLGQRQKKKWREMEDERKGLVEKAKARRADAALNNVIINENEDVLDEKYRLKKLPYPFENERQLASTLATPLGPDWNTETRTQLNIRPKYVAKAGKIISPIEMQQGTKKVQRTKTRRGKRKAGDGDD